MIFRRFIPFGSLLLLFHGLSSCVAGPDCAFKTSQGVCIVNGERNIANEAEVQEVMDYLVECWGRDFERSKVLLAMSRTVVEYQDGLTVTGGVPVAGVTEGSSVQISLIRNTKDTLIHEMFHVLLSSIARVPPDLNVHHGKMNDLSFFPSRCMKAVGLTVFAH